MDGSAPEIQMPGRILAVSSSPTVTNECAHFLPLVFIVLHRARIASSAKGKYVHIDQNNLDD